MKALTIVSAFILGLCNFSPSPVSAQEARNVAEFCVVWQRICGRTCPSGKDCSVECSRRASQCRSSGCFPFNSPGPRCFNSASDRALTDARRAPNPEVERKRRGY
jgi:hypothetical protein